MTSQEVTVTEIAGSISAHIPDVRATAELSRLTEYEATTLYGLEPGDWFWFNRLINQSGIPHIGTQLLDEVLKYCGESGYSILNQVNAYGDISQKDLEDWYIRKGFTPVDYGKYKNALLKWPKGEYYLRLVEHNSEYYEYASGLWREYMPSMASGMNYEAFQRLMSQRPGETRSAREIWDDLVSKGNLRRNG